VPKARAPATVIESERQLNMVDQPMRAPLLQVRGLGKDFGRGPVLDAIDLDLGPGAMVGLVGPNGAGKTTLLSLLMGLQRPTRGEVRVAGRALQSLSRRRLARTIALVPQDLEIGFAFGVREVVAMGRYPHLGRFQAPGSADLDAVQQAMVATGVDALSDRTIDTLSGGERQRVLIARAVAQQTPVVLLDEVTANLDLSHQLEVLGLARAMAADGRLVVAALHDLALASRYCDRLLLLGQGRLRADGPVGAVLTPDHLLRFFGVEASIEAAPGGGLVITPRLPGDGAAPPGA
jgi:iron complex transport system ATP-binding protein